MGLLALHGVALQVNGVMVNCEQKRSQPSRSASTLHLPMKNNPFGRVIGSIQMQCHLLKQRNYVIKRGFRLNSQLLCVKNFSICGRCLFPDISCSEDMDEQFIT